MIPSTIYPIQPDVPYIPIDISANQRTDFNWMIGPHECGPELMAGQSYKYCRRVCSFPAVPSTYSLSPSVQVTIWSRPT